MTRIAQKLAEERIARLLFHTLGKGPIQTIGRGTPTPDIVARLPDRTIGLEVTEIFTPPDMRGFPHQAVENYRTVLLEACAVEWRRREYPHTDVHLQFNPNVSILRNRISALTSQLCDVVAANLPQADRYIELNFDWERRSRFLPEEITAIRAVRFAQDGDSYWLGPDFGFVGRLTIELVQAAIDRKSLGDYRVPGTKSWLVIVAHGLRISGSFDLPEAVFQHRYRALFERMFLLELFSMRAYEIHAA